MLLRFNRKGKLLVATGILLGIMMFSPISKARAGEINKNEEKVITAAKSVFYYKGDAWVARETYISQLKKELRADDVDLTAKEAKEAVAEIYESVEKGIEEGYLKKVTKKQDKKEGQEREEESGNQVAGNPQGGEEENKEQAVVIEEKPNSLPALMEKEGETKAEVATSGGLDSLEEVSEEKKRETKKTDILLIVLGIAAVFTGGLSYKNK